MIAMNIYPSIAIFYIQSYYAINMINSTNIWVFMLLIVDVSIECVNTSNTKLDASNVRKLDASNVRSYLDLIIILSSIEVCVTLV
jgi:hypothetical protein